MIKIFLKNVYSTLSDYTEELEARLTVAHDGYWFSPQYKRGLWDGKTHFLKVPALKFPTGLRFIVEEYFKEKGIEYKIVDLGGERTVTAHWIDEKILQGIKLREYQQDAVMMGLHEQRGIFEVATGLGKTEIAIALTKLLKRRTLFLVHTQDLLRQTVERFEKRLGIKVGVVGDNQFDVYPDIVVATVQSIDSKMKRELKWAKNFLNSFQVMFQDETHHSSAMTFYKVGMFMHNAYYRFGLSGTPLRRSVLSNMKVMAVTGPVIYSKLAEEGIEEGFLSNIEVRIIDNPELVVGDKWQEIYDRAIVNSPTRNLSIVDLAEKEFKLGKKILILVRIIKHGEILKRMLARRKIVSAFIHGNHESDIREEVKEEFNKKGDFVLIASPIYDEGVDLPEVNVLIKASGGKSEVKTIQQVGRGLRPKKEKLIVYDFNDMNSKFLSTHSKKRIKTYKQEGFLK